MTKIEGVPDGYELVRIGAPKVGEFFINGNHVNKASECFDYLDSLAIVRKIEPPKPIEPPEGYRLLTEGEIVHKDDVYFFQDKFWDEVTPEARHSIGEPWSASTNVPFARKIQPKVRPMTRAEFLAAWKQRNFCPLLRTDNGNIEDVQVLQSESGDDKQLVYLGNMGWQTFDSLAKNYSWLYGEEPYAPLTIEE